MLEKSKQLLDDESYGRMSESYPQKQKTLQREVNTPLIANGNPISSRIASARPKNSSARVSFNIPNEDIYTDTSRTTATGDSAYATGVPIGAQENSNKILNKARI